MIINMQSGGVVPERIIDAQTITPSKANQVIDQGTYLKGALTILGDSDLLAENIKKGVSIFNVLGTLVDKINAGSFGYTKVDTGEFTCSAKTATGNITMNHSLGETPKLVIIIAEATSSRDSDYGLYGILYNSDWNTGTAGHNGVFYADGGTDSFIRGTIGSNQYASDKIVLSESSIQYVTDRNALYYKAGIKYHWFACA